MELFKNKYEKDSTRLRYTDYFNTSQEMLRLRKITPKEFQAVPKKTKSKLSLAFGSLAGVLFILTVFFALSGLKYCFDSIMAHDSDAWMMLFVFSMVDLLMLLVFGGTCLLKADDIVTEDSLVLAGEVTEVRLIRGSKGVSSADHFIAIHGSRQLVMINNIQPIMTGSTVLIVKSPRQRYHLVEIPEKAADFGNVGENYGEEISEGTMYTADDVKEFRKITLEQVRKEPLTSDELSEIPYKFRGIAPFSHGAATVCWIIFTILTIVMLVILHKARVEGNAELFFPLLCGFLCELFIELFVSSAVMGKRLSNKMCYYFDCVIIRKTRNSGLGHISAVIPEKKQYIEALKVDSELYDILPVNEPVRLYYNLNYPNARYAKRLYEDY